MHICIFSFFLKKRSLPLSPSRYNFEEIFIRVGDYLYGRFISGSARPTDHDEFLHWSLDCDDLYPPVLRGTTVVLSVVGGV